MMQYGTLSRLSQPSRVRAARTDSGAWTRFEALLLWALVMAGYPVVGIVSATLGLENTLLTYPFRGLVALLAVVVMVRAAARRQFTVNALILAFAMLYTARLLYDWLAQDIQDADFSLALFWIVAIVPALALANTVRIVDQRSIAIAIAIPATLTCILSLSTFLVGGDVVGVTTEAALGRLSFTTVNPITIGYTALYLMLAAFVLFWDASLRVRALLGILTLLAIVTLLQTGSRGPLVGAALCVAAIALVDGKQFLFWLILAFMAVFLLPFSGDIPLLDRLSTTGVDNSSIARVYAQQSAWDLALANPLLGYAYVETDYFTYPHILLLESAMAMGVVGFALMAIFQFQIIAYARKLMVSGYRLVPFIALCAFANAWLSGAIWGAFDFWVGLAVMGTMLSIEHSTESNRRSLATRSANQHLAGA